MDPAKPGKEPAWTRHGPGMDPAWTRQRVVDLQRWTRINRLFCEKIIFGGLVVRSGGFESVSPFCARGPLRTAGPTTSGLRAARSAWMFRRDKAEYSGFV